MLCHVMTLGKVYAVHIQGGPAKVKPNLLVTFECAGKIQ